MNVFEKVTESPEALASLLRAIPAIETPWDDAFSPALLLLVLGGGGREMNADFSHTCEGCEHVVTEPWAKDIISYRCFAPGRCKGRVVGVKRFDPYIPAWCPKLERSRENG